MPDFTERVVALFRALHPLDQVPRAGYVLRGVASPESVAAHSHFVALLALLFVERWPERYDARRTLAMALVHDLAEARLMDALKTSDELLTKRGIRHVNFVSEGTAHEWHSWRRHLNDFVPRLFK